MSDFSTQSLSDAPIAPTAEAPITTRKEAIVEGIGDAASIFRQVGSSVVSDRASRLSEQRYRLAREKEEGANRVVAQFGLDMLDLADSAQLNGESPSAVIVRGRANLRKAIATNPSYAKELMAQYNSTMTENGILGPALEFSPAEEAKRELEKQAAKNGVTPELQKMMNQQQEVAATIAASANALTAQINSLEAQDERTKNEVQRRAFELGEQTRHLIRENLPIKMRLIEERGNAILQQIEATSDDAEKAKLILEFDQLHNSILEENRSQKGFSGDIATEVSAMELPINNLVSTYRSMMTGELQADVGSAEVQRIKNQSTLTFTALLNNQPGGARVLQTAIFNAVLLDNNPTVAQNIANDVIRLGLYESLLGKQGQRATIKNPVDISEEGAKDMVTVFRDAFKSEDPEVVKEATTMVTRLMKGLSAYRDVDGALEDPQLAKKNTRKYLSLFAEENTGNFIRKNSVELTDEDLAGLNVAMGKYANDVLIPAVRQEWGKKITVPGYPPKVVLPKDEAVINFDGDRVVFEKKEADSDDMAIRSLNNTIGKEINLLIRATAHANGHTNYSKIWDSNKDKFMEIFE